MLAAVADLALLLRVSAVLAVEEIVLLVAAGPDLMEQPILAAGAGAHPDPK
jgi:hypothetical protein